MVVTDDGVNSNDLGGDGGDCGSVGGNDDSDDDDMVIGCKMF